LAARRRLLVVAVGAVGLVCRLLHARALVLLAARALVLLARPAHGVGGVRLRQADAKAILAERYARGEISRDQYRDRLGDLEA
jgi:uncharacterized membrane protein